jgi:formate hydrogenlyase transcriptional activator
MRLDGVALILPDGEGQELQLYARWIFPTAIPRWPASAGCALWFRRRPGLSFGKAMDRGYRAAAKAGLDQGVRGRSGDFVHVALAPRQPRARRSLPGALEKNAFNQFDLEFLSQIAGQVAIAIDNAFAYRQITELKDKLTQEKLYFEDELRSEMNFQEIIGNSTVLRVFCARSKR